MADIATCPKCAKQLGLPAATNATDRVECPECCASFSLAETVQIALPVARLLPPEEVQAELPKMAEIPNTCPETSSPTPTTEHCESADGPAPQQSWEERLKRALALDEASEDEPANVASPAPAEKTTPEAALEQNDSTEKVVSPSFEFQLDPPQSLADQPAPNNLDLELPAAVPELTATPKAAAKKAKPSAKKQPVKKQPAKKKPVKTLADFAASAVSSASEAIPSVSKLQSTDKVVNRGNASQHSVKPDEVPSKATSGRRLARRGFPKISALVVGPIAGSLLGLYGLLWLQGDKGDHLGLTHVLPASILPADADQPPEETEIAESTSSLHELLSKKSAQPPTKIKQDSAVKLASATRSVPPARIQAEQFVKLVDEASIAMPSLLAGEMTSQASIKRKGQAYMAVCRLSEHFDFAQQPGLSPAVAAKVREATKLFQDATSDQPSRQELAHIAGRWWEYDQRVSSGIFFSGQVQQASRTAEGTLCWVQLDDPSTMATIPVWVESGRFRQGDRVGVVGRVIASPSGLPQDFTGSNVVSLSYGFSL